MRAIADVLAVWPTGCFLFMRVSKKQPVRQTANTQCQPEQAVRWEKAAVEVPPVSPLRNKQHGKQSARGGSQEQSLQQAPRMRRLSAWAAV